MFSLTVFSVGVYGLTEHQNLLWWNKYSKSKYCHYCKRTANSAIYGQIGTATALIAISHSCRWQRTTPWPFTQVHSKVLPQRAWQDAVLSLQPGKCLPGQAGAACCWELYSHAAGGPIDPKVMIMKYLVSLRKGYLEIWQDLSKSDESLTYE